MAKLCSRCKEDFEPTKASAGYCKPCGALKKKESYYRNRQGYLDRAKKARINKRQWLYNYFLEHPCEQCGESRPECLDFDHIDPSTKEYNISKYRDSLSWEKLLTEIAKCRILCANCHRVHTAKQMGWYADIYKGDQNG